MSDFRDCVVSFIDLNNVSKVLNSRSKKGVAIMRRLHKLVNERVDTLSAHEEVCFWQDSVLLLAFVDDSPASFARVMHDVQTLKAKIEELYPCHAVCVKGQAFPAPPIRTRRRKPRSIYLSASSLAFSNCFTIEHTLKRHRADWYLDSRITNMVDMRAPDNVERVKLLPRLVSRKIHVFHGSFT